MAIVMQGKDAVSARLAECFVTIDGTRYNFAQCINLEARMEKNKAEFGVLGRNGVSRKTTSWTGTGSATFHYNSSIFRKAMKRYKDTSEDFYFEIQVTNEDPTSAVGAQTTVLKGCNLDSVIVAKFDVEGEILDEDLDFTFEDWEIPKEFSELEGMR